MTDKEFAIIIRRMLLAIVAKIEQRYKLEKYADVCVQQIDDGDNIVSVVYER